MTPHLTAGRTSASGEQHAQPSRNLRGTFDDVPTTVEEDQALLTVFGAALGIGAAFLVDLYGPDPESSTLTITITQARATLLSALALVFSGLSIVLALVALTTGNMANKFSPRFLRMKLRHSSDHRCDHHRVHRQHTALAARRSGDPVDRWPDRTDGPAPRARVGRRVVMSVLFVVLGAKVLGAKVLGAGISIVA